MTKHSKWMRSCTAAGFLLGAAACGSSEGTGMQPSTSTGGTSAPATPSAGSTAATAGKPAGTTPATTGGSAAPTSTSTAGSAGKPATTCVKAYDKCMLATGVLGICDQVDCQEGQAGPCLICRSQH